MSEGRHVCAGGARQAGSGPGTGGFEQSRESLVGLLWLGWHGWGPSALWETKAMKGQLGWGQEGARPRKTRGRDQARKAAGQRPCWTWQRDRGREVGCPALLAPWAPSSGLELAVVVEVSVWGGGRQPGPGRSPSACSLSARYFFNKEGDFNNLTAAAYHKKVHLLVTGFASGIFHLHELPEFNLIHSLR